RYVSPVMLHDRADFVRRGFNYNCFNTGWYRAHPNAWVAQRWRFPNYWAAPVWASTAAFCGIHPAPVLSDSGSGGVVSNDPVYLNGNSLGSVDQYADQAIQFVDRGREAAPAPNDEWQPLGVFGLISSEDQTAQHVFQLAINSSGIVRGNYYDGVGDNTM